MGPRESRRPTSAGRYLGADLAYDELLTTRLAESSARAGASAPADALAAAHLLDTYLLHLAGAGEGPGQ